MEKTAIINVVNTVLTRYVTDLMENVYLDVEMASLAKSVIKVRFYTVKTQNIRQHSSMIFRSTSAIPKWLTFVDYFDDWFLFELFYCLC